MRLLLLAGHPLHQKIYVPLGLTQGQEFSPHDLGIEAQIPARLVKRELPSGAVKGPPVGGYLTAQDLPLLSAGWEHLPVAQTPVATAQLPNVVMGPNENFCTKPPPASLALLNDVLVVVFRYGDGDHYFVGASQ
jgi:hypothetical protein